jgi:acetyl esterase/lipase
MSRTLTTVLCLCLCVCIRSLAAQPAPTQFERWDRNGDGKLAPDELPENVRGNFSRVDRDSDGFISPEEDRAFRTRNQQNAERDVALPETVRVLRDLSYAESQNPRQTLHLMLPKSPEEGKRLPVIVYIHGGGWRNGEKSGGLRTLLPYVESGAYAGATLGYRLSGEARWPAQILDCKAALRWIRGHADEYGLHPERIGVIGTSAGGHLVSMLGVTGGVANLEGDLGGHDDQSSRVTCVVNMYGPAELLTMNDSPSNIDHDAPDSPESLLIGGPIQELKPLAENASPVTHVTSDDAPFLHVHGTQDMLVPFTQAERLHARLSEAGVPSLLVPVTGGGHGGFSSPDVTRRIRQFFDRHLQGREETISTEPIPQETSRSSS